MMKIETLAVHAGGGPDAETGAVAPPIHLATTFEHGPGGEKIHGYMYARNANPTQSRLEEALAALDGGEAALVFGSGVAAGAAVLQSLPAGSHVIFPDDVYYNFRVMALDYLPRWGCEATIVDMGDAAAVRAAVRPSTKLIWMETPSNPLLKVTDVGAIAAICRETGAISVVDSTFATPVLLRPIEHGADVVLHATTKYFGGHSDVQGGALVFAKKGEVYSAALRNRDVLGAIASPFSSWLVLRGVRSLPCRVERQSASAMAVAQFLARNSAVEAVHYPGLAGDAGHDVAARQMKFFGGMLSFRVKGGRASAIEAVSRARLFVVATSLGGTESLIEHRASSEGPGSTTPENLIRLSMGLEHAEDLIEDLAGMLG